MAKVGGRGKGVRGKRETEEQTEREREKREKELGGRVGEKELLFL